MATASIEEIAAIPGGPKIFQLYLLNDEALNFAMIDRCKAAGFDALCLTVDTVVAGNRERDLRTGLTIPPSPHLGGLPSFAAHPRWCLDHLPGTLSSLPNLSTEEEGGRQSGRKERRWEWT